MVRSDEEEFFRFCEDPGYIRINDTIALTNKITSDIKGVFPELLLANMLTNMGYTKVFNRIKPRILKAVDGELDTIGFKYVGEALSHVIIFESKGQATDENELQLEVKRFSDNIHTVQKNLEALCNELRVPYSSNVEVEAIFVSMDILEKRKSQKSKRSPVSLLFTGRPSVEVPDNVGLWDFDELLSKLRQAHVPRKYLELLKRIPVAVILDPFPIRKPLPGTIISSPNNGSS